MGIESEGAAWSPYLVGALIGVLSMATFYLSDKPLGVSTSYARLAGLIGNLFSKGHTETLKFYQDKKPRIEWEVMLMFGIILGAFLAAASGGELTRTWVPTLWDEHFGGNALLRSAVASSAARSWRTARGSPAAAPAATGSAARCSFR